MAVRVLSALSPKASSLGLIGALALTAPFAHAPAAAQQQPQQQQQTARVEAGQLDARIERNFARLVFTFAERPRHQVTAHAGVVVVRFDRPIDVPVARLAQTLRGYIGGVRVDADRQAVRFALDRRLRVNTTEAGDQLYVDLLPEPWQGAVPALPPEVVAELQRRAEEAERLRVEEAARSRRRTAVGPVEIVPAETPTFSRMEFRWRERIAPTIQRSGREVRIIFDRLGQFEGATPRVRLPRFVEAIRVSEEDVRSVVTLTIDPVRDIRTFVEGNAFNIDVLGPERGRGMEFRADGSLLPSTAPAVTTGPATTIAGEPDEEPAAETPPQRRDATAPARPAAPGQRPRAEATERPASIPLSRVERAREPAVPTGPTSPVSIDMTEAAHSAELRMFFPQETPAAVFLRGRTLWLVFDTPHEIDAERFRRGLPRLVRAAQRQRIEDSEVIRLDLDRIGLVSARAEGLAWILAIGEVVAEGVRAVEVRPRHLPDGRAFSLAQMPNPSRTITIPDPIVGDVLTIVTARAPASSFVKPQRFVDFDLLATAHGMAMRWNVEGLAVRFVDEGVVVERDQGLSLTTGTQTRADPLSPAVVTQARAGFVDFEGWKLGPVDRFTALRDGLVQRAAMAEGPARTGARLDLARFFISHNLGPEAVSLLAMTAREDPAAEREISFRFLRAVANVLAGRLTDAERDLEEPRLANNQDVALWRGLVAVGRDQWAQARRHLQFAQPIIGDYPRTLQARALRGLAEALLELNDVATAGTVLDEARTLDPEPAAQAHVALLRGRLAQATGRDEVALDTFLRAANAGTGAVAAEAQFRRIDLALQRSQMQRADAISALESLAMGWRGDDIEMRAYRLLAGLYVETGNHREAFAAMNRAVRAAPNSPITRDVQDRMQAAFADHFLEGGADGRPPLETLALFYDFRELTPPGRRGDEMIRNLAERLIDVDLLDQAAELLEHQVNNRLQGAARAEVASQLAFVHLANRAPEKALAALRRTGSGGLPRDLERRRTLVEARALAAIGRAELAIELLAETDGTDAERLKADLLWEGRDWAGAGAGLERVLTRTFDGIAPVTDAMRQDVLRAAVAFALAGDQASLDRLRLRFSAAMAEGPEAAAFAVVAGRVETQGAEFRAIARQIGQVDTMARFLRDYRERAPRRDAPARPERVAAR